MDSYAEIISHIADDIVLPSLRHCILRGLPCNEDSLLKYFKNHSEIENLELREMKLLSGSLKSVFGHLCTLPYLQNVVLHNIIDGRRLISLAPKHGVHKKNIGDDDHSFSCYNGTLVHTRTFSREEIQEENSSS